MSTLLSAALLALQAPGLLPPRAPEPAVAELPSSASPARPAAAEDPERPRSWRTLNKVDLIINGDCITQSDVTRLAARGAKPATTAAEREKRRLEVGLAYLRSLVRVQAGKDLGYDQKMIDSFVRDQFVRELEVHGSISRLADELALGEGSAEFKGSLEARTYGQLWTYSTIGLHAGPGGRPYVDRHVRPGRLAFEFARRGESLDLPEMVTLRELIVPVRQGEDLDAASRRAGALRTRIAAGEDFLEAARALDAYVPGGDGLKDYELSQVVKLQYVQPFIAAAVEGELSEVLPVYGQSGLEAFRILRLEQRRGAKAATFSDQEVQSYLVSERQRTLDERRIAVATRRLLGAAYVWPPAVREPVVPPVPDEALPPAGTPLPDEPAEPAGG